MELFPTAAKRFLISPLPEGEGLGVRESLRERG
jgi:hypothetical protein